MPGITAVSASATLAAAATSTDNSSSGWITGERIVLGVTPTGSEYVWGQSVPSSSSTARSALDSTTSATPVFIADVGGIYILTVTVDKLTSYTLKLTVQNVSVAEPEEAVRWSPRLDATIPAPTLGLATYFSGTFGNLACKDASARVWPLLRGAMGTSLTDANQTLTVAGGQRYVIPAATLTMTRTKTLDAAGAVRGNVIEITRHDVTANTCDVAYGGTGTPLTFAASTRHYAKFTFDGVAWQLTERGPLS